MQGLWQGVSLQLTSWKARSSYIPIWKSRMFSSLREPGWGVSQLQTLAQAPRQKPAHEWLVMGTDKIPAVDRTVRETWGRKCFGIRAFELPKPDLVLKWPNTTGSLGGKEPLRGKRQGHQDTHWDYVSTLSGNIFVLAESPRWQECSVWALENWLSSSLNLETAAPPPWDRPLLLPPGLCRLRPSKKPRFLADPDRGRGCSDGGLVRWLHTHEIPGSVSEESRNEALAFTRVLCKLGDE